ncbi:MAG TPA: GAF domain-containing protein [Acidimicrobiales bacterium]|jgi:GAF domain-containing protein|nr:GAF domain-containing protein [Acidimicrobiales bacterium]
MPQTADKLKRLVEVATQLNSTLNLDELLAGIMSATTELLEAESSSLLLLDEEADELEFKVATGDPELVGVRMPSGQGIAGAALAAREPVVQDNVAGDTRHYSEVDKAAGSTTRNLVAVPLVLKDRPIGVLEAINRPAAELAGEDLEIARALASLAAVAIDNATMYARLADAVVAARMSYRI